LNAGATPIRLLSKAAATGYLDIVRFLLDMGSDANLKIGSKCPLVGAIATEDTMDVQAFTRKRGGLEFNGYSRGVSSRGKGERTRVYVTTAESAWSCY
jgi:hypothetical protein